VADRPKLPSPTLRGKFRSEISFAGPEPSPRAPPKRLSGRRLRAHIPVMDDRERDTGEPQPPVPPREVQAPVARPREIGGPKGPEPTRYGDWEYNGRFTDF